MDDRVLGILVTYYPNRRKLSTLVRILSPQLYELLIVDNTPDEKFSADEMLRNSIMGINNLIINIIGENVGIAAAQNIGIKKALSENYSYIFFSDQDSLPDKDMVSVLRGCCEELHGLDVKVGSISPEYYDLNTNQLFNFQVWLPGKLFYRNVSGQNANPWIEIVTTISSGSLIPCEVFRSVGMMDEGFFIDHVDIEWCHRARAKGFHLYGTSRTQFKHCLGENVFRMWLFGWKSQGLYSPLRLYYRFRNFVLMCRLPHVPLRWSIRAGWYWLGNIYAYCLFAPGRWANSKAIALGLWDGLRGRAGPYHGKSLDNRGLNTLMQDGKPMAKKQE